MTVRDTSLLAYEQIKERLGPDEQAVFEILLEIGPAHDRRILEALNQKEAATIKPKSQKRKWEINSVTGRRNALVNIYGIIEDLGPHKGQWHGKNKTYHIWRVVGDDRVPVGWHKVEKNLPRGIHIKKTIPVISLSEAARVLVRGRKDRRNHRYKNQMQLFAEV